MEPHYKPPEQGPLFTRGQALRAAGCGVFLGSLIVAGGHAYNRFYQPQDSEQPIPTEVPQVISTALAQEVKTAVPPPKIKPPISTEIVGLPEEHHLIDGIVTYGAINSLDGQRLQALYESINKNPAPRDNNTYYGSFFVREYVFNRFQVDNGESLPSFLKRHVELLGNRANELSNGIRTEARRLIVIGNDQGVNRDGSIDEGIFYNLLDSNGGWFFHFPYLPHKSSVYDPRLKIDRALLHELGHAMLRLGDEYSLDFAQAPSPAFEGVAPAWQSYKVQIPGESLMSNNGINMGGYNLRLLDQRLKNNSAHSKETQEQASWNFPNDVPNKIRFLIASKYKGMSVEIYQTYEVDADKRSQYYERKKGLVLAGKTTIADFGNTTGLDFFPKSFLPPESEKNIPSERGTFFLRVVNGNGDLAAFRWFDVRTLNLAKWEKGDNAVKVMNLATNADDPVKFWWPLNDADMYKVP